MKLLNLSKLTARVLLIAVLLLTPFLVTEPVSADTPISITNYNSGTGSGLVTGNDGSLWYVSTSLKRVYKVSTSGVITYYSFPNPSQYNDARNVIKGPDGNIWFSVHRPLATSEMKAYSIMRVNSQGNFTVYDLPFPPDKIASSSVSSIAFVKGELWISRDNTCRIQILNPNVTGGEVRTFQLTKPTDVIDDHYCRDTTSIYDLFLYDAQEIVMNPADNSVYIVTRVRVPTGGLRSRQYIEKISLFDGDRTLTYLDHTFSDLPSISLAFFDTPDRLWFTGPHDTFGYFNVNSESGSLHTLPMSIRSMTRGPDGNYWFTAKQDYDFSVYRFNLAANTITDYPMNGTSTGNTPSGSGAVWGPDGNYWVIHASNSKINKINFGTMPNSDADGDGLNYLQELQQGTTDYAIDADSDGLSDYVESQWNTARDNIFCHPTTNYCEYPDPLQQDVYTEIDWMERPGSGGFSTKPSSAQIDSVKTAFADKGIKAHFDTGQLGGGQELTHENSIYYLPEAGERDLYDYRDGEEGESQSFATDRRDIFHYMISADNVAYESSGVSNPAADESIVAYGYVKDDPSMYEGTFDTAISGTIIHELGHGLCLTDDTVNYYSQNPACVFDGVDNGTPGTALPYPFYVSSMNYSYQFEIVDYSDGENIAAHPTGDYDDWSTLGLKDYTQVDILNLLGNQARMAVPSIFKTEPQQKLQIALTAKQAKKIKQAREKAGIKIKKDKNGKFEVTQTQNGRTKRLN